MSDTTPGVVGLDWTVKRSFVEYIARMPDGKMSVTDGADVEGTIFRFSLSSHHDHGPSGTAAFKGDLRFVGHRGLLFVCIIDPIVTYEEQRASLSIQLPAQGSVSAERIDLARGVLDPVGQSETARSYAVSGLSLTEDGSDLFAGAYAPEALLDDLIFTIPR